MTLEADARSSAAAGSNAEPLAASFGISQRSCCRSSVRIAQAAATPEGWVLWAGLRVAAGEESGENDAQRAGLSLVVEFERDVLRLGFDELAQCGVRLCRVEL